jgi:hypothetical protein
MHSQNTSRTETEFLLPRDAIPRTESINTQQAKRALTRGKVHPKQAQSLSVNFHKWRFVERFSLVRELVGKLFWRISCVSEKEAESAGKQIVQSFRNARAACNFSSTLSWQTTTANKKEDGAIKGGEKNHLGQHGNF